MTKRISLEDLGYELRLLPAKVSEATANVLCLPWFEDTAKSLCPVDTLALLSSIRTEARGLHEVAIVAGGGGFANPRTGREVDYARDVHDGTSRMPPRPFLLQAVLLERERYLREMLAETAGMIQMPEKLGLEYEVSVTGLGEVAMQIQRARHRYTPGGGYTCTLGLVAAKKPDGSYEAKVAPVQFDLATALAAIRRRQMEQQLNSLRSQWE